MALSSRLTIQFLLMISLVLSATWSLAGNAKPPNILWLSIEDASPHIGAYGDDLASTPNLDSLGSEGVLYTHAFTTAGVCAPSRSAIITGMYQTSLGTHHMRNRANLPGFMRPFPEYLREAGYYCTNNSKEDYQFITPPSTWDDSSNNAHWRNRPNKDQPFFAVFNYTGCHESGIADDAKYHRVTEGIALHDRTRVSASLPPYYPNTAVARENWGRYYDVMSAMDRWVGERLLELEQDGLTGNTIVFFWSDHGVGLPRAKRWLYDSGTRVPLIVRIPELFRVENQGFPGEKNSNLISLIDLGPTVLNLAGLKIPEHMQGLPFLGPETPEPRKYVFGARDRMDERYDIIRSVRDTRFRYIRNYEPFKVYYQFMNTPEKGSLMREIRRVFESGTASIDVARYFRSKPTEELYDTVADPHEVNNLARAPGFEETLKRMRKAHEDWVLETGDLGLFPEVEIARRQRDLGAAWSILRRTGTGDLMRRIRDTAAMSLRGPIALPDLAQPLEDPDPAVRYWALIGIGNQGTQAWPFQPRLVSLLQDSSEIVRLASARALAKMGIYDRALPVLIDCLDNGSQWARLFAANVLDEIGVQARPAAEDMKRNLHPRPEMVQNGKYTVRVLNRVLNQLLGTHHEVP